MKKLILIFSIFLSVESEAQTPQTSYVVQSISSMESYYGNANRIYVAGVNHDYAICSPCTVNDSTIFSGAGGRKWMKVSDSSKADVGNGGSGSSTDNWDSVLTRQTTPMSNNHRIDFGGHYFITNNLSGLSETTTDGGSDISALVISPVHNEFTASSDSTYSALLLSDDNDNGTRILLQSVNYNTNKGHEILVNNDSVVIKSLYVGNTILEIDNVDSSNANPNNIAWFDNQNILHRGYMQPNLKSYTVSTLPALPTQGDEAAVTDATSPTYLGALTGGGSTYTPVVFNGTIWVSH